MKKKWIGAFSAVIIFCLVLAGCGGRGGQEPVPASEEAEEDMSEEDMSEADTSEDAAEEEGYVPDSEMPEDEIDPSQEVDYSDQANWAYFGIGEDKEADLFLICPTVDTKSEGLMSLSNEKTRASFLGALNMERGIYEDSARMFAPYYRQAAMPVYSMEEEERDGWLDQAYSDVSNAFAWYLENENDGRPIILAGFSQGADMCYRLLEEFFGDEELYDQLVAVYALGWPMTEEMTETYPQILPAQGEDDTGVVISFDCEAPEVTESFINPAGVKALSINPLSWKTDGEKADKSLNLGACFTDYDGNITSETAGLCGCYIDPDRGTLKVTDVTPEEYPALLKILPEGGYHIYDYQFFFRNLQENVKTRLDAYIEAQAADDAA